MANRRSARSAEEGTIIPSDRAGGPSWRALLSGHADRIWREGAGVDGSGNLVDRLTHDLGPLAEEAVRIVESYTLGAKSQASAVDEAPPPEFHARLNLILNGFDVRPPAANLGARTGHGRPVTPQVFQSELWQVLKKMRESAELSYAREVDLVELDRRILILLQSQGPLVPAELSGAIGVDKAQVSRSVKRLLELKLVERRQIRSPITLTRRGEMLADRLLRLADLRNRELTFDIGDEELKEFFSSLEVLLDRAITLYDEERARSQGVKLELEIRVPEERKPGDPVIIDRSRIVSPLMTLAAYFSRSGALTYKRLTGLSNFEAWVLSEISHNPPTDWATLTRALERDHSQAGRTVRSLIDRGIVQREGKAGRRHGKFSPTAEGQKLYDIIHETSIKRSIFLLAPLGKEREERFIATFDRIRRNAVAQLERERAFEELERG